MFTLGFLILTSALSVNRGQFFPIYHTSLNTTICRGFTSNPAIIRSFMADRMFCVPDLPARKAPDGVRCSESHHPAADLHRSVDYFAPQQGEPIFPSSRCCSFSHIMLFVRAFLSMKGPGRQGPGLCQGQIPASPAGKAGVPRSIVRTAEAGEISRY